MNKKVVILIWGLAQNINTVLAQELTYEQQYRFAQVAKQMMMVGVDSASRPTVVSKGEYNTLILRRPMKTDKFNYPDTSKPYLTIPYYHLNIKNTLKNGDFFATDNIDFHPNMCFQVGFLLQEPTLRFIENSIGVIGGYTGKHDPMRSPCYGSAYPVEAAGDPLIQYMQANPDAHIFGINEVDDFLAFIDNKLYAIVQKKGVIALQAMEEYWKTHWKQISSWLE